MNPAPRQAEPTDTPPPAVFELARALARLAAQRQHRARETEETP